MDYNKFKLENGVRVLEVPMKCVRSVAVLVFVKTGSRNELDKQSGISHVLEHMAFKGTDKYPTPLDLAEVVDSYGAEFNAFTGKEYTGYYIKSASNHVRKSLEILSEMLIHSKLRADDLEREKGVIVEEINMYEDMPMERAGEEFENLMFGGCDLGRLIIGSKKSVNELTNEDLRLYMDDWYGGGNVLVVVTGKIDEDVKSVVGEYFSDMSKGKKNGFVSDGKFGSGKKNVVKKDTEQAHFVMGVPGVKFSDDRRYALNMMRIALGGNMSSRLFTEVREKRGLAYYVQATKQEYVDIGYLGVRAGVKLGSLKEAIDVVKEELMKVGKDITNEELSMAKEFFKGKFVLSLEDPLGVAKFMGESELLLDDVRQPLKMMERVGKVSLDEVRKISEEVIIDDEMRMVVVGPYSDDLELTKKK